MLACPIPEPAERSDAEIFTDVTSTIEQLRFTTQLIGNSVRWAWLSLCANRIRIYNAGMNDSSPQDPDTLDVAVPSVARVYDFALGGKDNFEVDRRYAEGIIDRDPEVLESIRLNKAFGQRVVTYLANQGVRQFLDLGSGIPTSPPSVHDTARAVIPDANVVYVDHDPVVVAHNQALRAVGPGLAVMKESFLNADQIFEHPDFVSNIDLEQPVAVLFLSVLQNTPDDIVRDTLHSLRERLAPGSFLAISHLIDRTTQAVKDTIHEQSQTSGYPPVWIRGEAELAGFFNGWELVDPGIVDYLDWHPDEELADNRPDLNTQFSCGVGKLAK